MNLWKPPFFTRDVGLKVLYDEAPRGFHYAMSVICAFGVTGLSIGMSFYTYQVIRVWQLQGTCPGLWPFLGTALIITGVLTALLFGFYQSTQRIRNARRHPVQPEIED